MAYQDAVPASQTDASDEIDLGELLDVLLDGKWLIVALTALVTAIGVLYAQMAAPVFKADALVQIESEGNNLGAVFGEMGTMLETSSSATGEIELIKSRLVLGRTIRDLKLYLDVRPKTLPIIGPGLARLQHGEQTLNDDTPWMFGAASIAGNYLRVSRFDVPASHLNKAFVIRVLEEKGHYTLLSPMGTVLGNGQAGQLLDLSDLGVRILVSELDAAPNQEYLVRRLDPLQAVTRLQSQLGVSEKGKDSGIISLTLEASSGEKARQVLNSIANNYLRQNVERKGEEAEQTLSYLKKQLPELREKLDESEAQLNIYRSSRGSADLMQETEIILQQSAKLEAMRFELDQERKKLIQRFKPGHPTVEALDAQVRDVEKSQADLEEKIKDLPETQQELLRLTRDVKVNTELYTSLLNSSQQLEVAKAGTVGTVRIIDYAQTPLDPIKPKKMLIVVLSVMLGGMLGIAVVFLRRVLLGTMDDPQAIEQQFGLPIYASVPMSKGQNKLAQLMKKHVPGLHTLQSEASDPIALEAIKSLRTSLHFALHDAPNNVVLLTGPRPGIGKSFIAANLADVYASTGKRVALVDCDMRRGTLHQYTGTKRKPGLADFLVDRASLNEVLHDLPTQGLAVVTTGTIPPNPSELLSSERFEEFISALSEQFDVVYLDSPPNLAVADAGILAQRAGSTLLVLAAGMHPQREIAESVKRLKVVGANLRGVVLNMVSLTARRYGYGRYSYHYAYESKKS